MNCQEMFGGAAWVCAGSYAARSALEPDPAGVPHFPLLRSRFEAGTVTQATLYVLGLGFFHCWINGQRVSSDEFLPLSTDYEPRVDYPVNEVVTGHRTYVPKYDVTELLQEGENLLALQFGGGWYTYEEARFGAPKAIYRLVLETGEGTREVVSSLQDRIGDSFVRTYSLTGGEHQDFRGWDDSCLYAEYDDSAWPCCQAAEPPKTEYLFSDCPADRLQLPVTPVCLAEEGGVRLYDAGTNSAAVPVLWLTGTAGEKVTLRFYEALAADGRPDEKFSCGQSFTVVCDGVRRMVRPQFTWYGFRYFTMEGPALPEHVCPVHTDVQVTSSFECSDETLNWLYHAFLNTQLSNMHAGIPSDCPHLERRGYTGDGQLICHAAMSVLGAKSFYRKWIDDIGDCQDTLSGHVQYTAPYTRCGGGPGGWGCAIVEVPWQYYRHYGDTEPLRRLYPQMLRYFDYLEAHSDRDLVVSDQPGQWCLGDWCAPKSVLLPAPFVNNYFYIRSLQRVVKIAALIGKEADIPALKKTIETRKNALMSAYFNTWDGNFMGSEQGANAFALDIGAGDERTYPAMKKFYTGQGQFDTGIFGTELVTRLLFEHGDADLATGLLASTGKHSFAAMKAAGATSLWENWPEGNWERSLNHPMFGAVTAALFDYILGIRAEEAPGEKRLRIVPQLPSLLSYAKGSRTLPAGKVSVSWLRREQQVQFCIKVPSGVESVLVYGGTEIPLKPGMNNLKLPQAE